MAIKKYQAVGLILIKEAHGLRLACDDGTDIGSVFVLQVVANGQSRVRIIEIQIDHSILCEGAFQLF
jgi:hypothetical protein